MYDVWSSPDESEINSPTIMSTNVIVQCIQMADV